MPRRAKGPRLYLRSARPERSIEAVWVIRDGTREISTGCPPERLHGPEGAEQKLADYLAAKWSPDAPTVRTGDPAAVLVTEALAFYAQGRAPKLADPVSNAGWIQTLAAWWGEKTLADVKMSTCEAYVAHRIKQPLKVARTEEALKARVTVAAARRELEVLSAAIGFWAKEYPLHPRPIVSLPPKGEGSRDALTVSQGAALLKAAMGYRKLASGSWVRLGKAAIANRAHLRRFVLLGLYTGSRPGVNIKLLWEEGVKQAWVDLGAGTIYRRGKGEVDHKTKRRPLVRLPDRLLAHMRRWREADKKLGVVTVLHHGGRPISGKIRTGFAAIVRDAGLDPDITPHWLRHTAATWLMQDGVSLWDAAGYLGMSSAVLESHYGHHRPDHQDAARKNRRRG